jgi:hypothetical protein
MQLIKNNNSVASLIRRTGAIVGLLLALAALSLSGARTAHAQVAGGGSGRSAGCPVVDGDGNVVGHAEVGTRVGLFYCGSDGDWHFGWFTSAAPLPPLRAPAPPSATITAVSSGVLR